MIEDLVGVQNTSYAEAQKCFIDVAMRTMQASDDGGTFSVNPGMIDTFKADAIAARVAVGKSESEVMEDLRQAVAEGAAETGLMSQAEKERYVLNTNDHAISCLKSKRDKLAQEGPARPSANLVEEDVDTTRRASCALTNSESQKVFDEFIRLEDSVGKDNAAHEVTVRRNNGVTPECVRQTMIASLESGRVPPDPA